MYSLKVFREWSFEPEIKVWTNPEIKIKKRGDKCRGDGNCPCQQSESSFFPP